MSDEDILELLIDLSTALGDMRSSLSLLECRIDNVSTILHHRIKNFKE